MEYIFLGESRITRIYINGEKRNEMSEMQRYFLLWLARKKILSIFVLPREKEQEPFQKF